MIETTHVGTEAPAGPVEQRSMTSFRNAVAIFRATLREIFDESAYQRFLNREHLPTSRTAYAAFRREQETRKARQPKCC